MNKLECDIIKDLLPLYIDGVESKASKEAVENHIAQCEACKAELESTKNCPTPKIANISSKEELKNVRNTIKRNKKKSVIKAIAITLIIVITISWFGFKGVLLNLSGKTYEALNIAGNVTPITVTNTKFGTENAFGLMYSVPKSHTVSKVDNEHFYIELKKSEDDIITVSKNRLVKPSFEDFENSEPITASIVKMGIKLNGLTPTYSPYSDSALIEFILSTEPPKATTFSPFKKFMKCFGFYEAAWCAVVGADKYYTVSAENFHGWGYYINAGAYCFTLMNDDNKEYYIAFRGDYTLDDVNEFLSSVTFE